MDRTYLPRPDCRTLCLPVPVTPRGFQSRQQSRPHRSDPLTPRLPLGHRLARRSRAVLSLVQWRLHVTTPMLWQQSFLGHYRSLRSSSYSLSHCLHTYTADIGGCCPTPPAEADAHLGPPSATPHTLQFARVAVETVTVATNSVITFWKQKILSQKNFLRSETS
jgi:hypothetical protein